MPAAVEVVPTRWTNLRVLFDDGKYSIVAGEYDGDRALGERWNGGSGLGFPNVSGHPVWHVIPSFLRSPVLHGILEELAVRPDDGNVQAVLDEIAWVANEG